ncbi:DUF3048 domain-containing protein [Paenibacillus puerhi]|uniref:DUF3048 domain-containing protein n=1 Tax=Paenibacillus puerhi TaxID=2692622 RepID=UPI00135C3F7F|nr:DUF3048 domain-containing protein [Paenibacillus puerhi]
MKEGKRQGSRALFALLACALAWTAAGCSPDKPPIVAPSGQEPVETVIKPVETPVVRRPAHLAPLTGVESEDRKEARTVMVVVNNAPQARPQSGLMQADLLFEVLAEGEITRLIAFFQSQSTTDPVGPVRSIRPYFISLGKGYGAVQVHAGGSPDGYETIRKQKIENLDEITNSGPYFWRDKSRQAPHNLYTSIDSARQGAVKRGFGELGPMSPVYSFVRPEPADEAQAARVALGTADSEVKQASKVDITFLLKSYRVSYEYEETSRLYKRSINDNPHIDQNNGETLKAANVLVMGTKHRVLDNEGRRDVVMTGSGPALLFQQGTVRTVEWKRAQESDPIRWFEQGREISLMPGQTHVMIVPDQPTFEEHVVY